MKKNKINFWIIFLLVLTFFGGILIGYYFLFSAPDYIKSGVVTLVFTTPNEPATDDLRECVNVVKVFIDNIFWSKIDCSYQPSKYFPGEIDCVCKF